MKPDLLKLLLASPEPAAIPDYLDQTSFDEMAEIDLNRDRFRNVLHTENKYMVPVRGGSFTALYRYACDHLVHPEDRSIYCALLEPETMEERLDHAAQPGVLQAEVRLLLVDGSWRMTWHLLIGGQRLGMKKGVMRCYIFDVESPAFLADGEAKAAGKPRNLRRDGLTGLLLEKDFFALAEEKRKSVHGAWCLIAVDIEHFKLFTDWHGREKGLYVLARFGEVLRRAAAETDGLAGYRGQDDFCLMVPYDRPWIDALFSELSQVIISLSKTVGFSPLFGVSVIEDDEEILETFNHAALSAEEIKGNVHIRIREYDGALKRKKIEEYGLLVDFQRALESGEISFWLQPQCRVSSRKIVGAESLARWRRPDGTWLAPALFVPILERHGIVTNLDEFIWESVCRWLRGIMDRGYHPVPISMNVSQIDLFTIDVPAYFAALLEKYRLPAGLLKIEITESAYVDDTEAVRATVKKLRDMGFLVLMDDFGSGYSSLNMLRSLNVDVIKLDAQFLHLSKQEEERKGIGILESVINMAKTLSTPIIVEGVENQEQAVFLSGLGCRYMQGYYFHRPMPPEDFEALIADDANTDHHGFLFNANQEMHVREFLDENVFSDAMLNSILGPVAFYNWKGDQVDIVRYNQQFFLMVGVDQENFNHRINGMQQYVYPEDQGRFFRTMEQAMEDRMNGAGGVFRVYRPNGVLCWIQVHMYFMGEDERGRRFYSSNQDVTELQYLNTDLPGGYYRCSERDGFEFQYISRNFQSMTGYTAQEIQNEFDNRLINMVHPQDRGRLMQDVETLKKTGRGAIRPYRLRKKTGGYFYAAEQCQLTDLFGPTCWQSVLLDVTEVMMLRNQMRMLARFSSDSIIFTHHTGDVIHLELVIHGLEGRSGLSREVFERALNDGTFYQWVEDGKVLSHERLDQYFESHTNAFEREFMVHPPNGHHIRLHMKTDRVTDESLGVEYITVLREI